MNTTVENIKVKKLQRTRNASIDADKNIHSKHKKSDGLLVLFQCPDKVFEGWQFFEIEIYEGLFIPGKL
ncbi:hypothetical protein QWZ08_10600 [Ferruginibacter paludis]|uniref:hypothetical protein n=1 Tax=Ferruginibacter paludis TaxID=1310417 RepID=UPI0025B4A22C|nr:hypothetical protein [Ferruginibacter paludis]MDN3656077.1 hypothetical protein [Ferruginibacter paludis]